MLGCAEEWLELGWWAWRGAVFAGALGAASEGGGWGTWAWRGDEASCGLAMGGGLACERRVRVNFKMTGWVQPGGIVRCCFRVTV